MIRKTLFAVALMSAGMISGTRTSDAAPPLQIQWLPRPGLALGNGCPNPGDAQFIAFGPDVSVLFRNFGINIKKGSGELNDLKQCSVRIPAIVPNGVYKSELTQALTYGVNKSAGSTGVITTKSTFFNLAVSPLTVNIPSASMQNPAVTAQRVTNILMLNACSGESKDGIYKSDIAVSARRLNLNQDIIVATAGLDLRYDITNVIFRCP